MPTFFKLLVYLAGILAIVMGVHSIATRTAKFPGSEDRDEHRMVEGIPAIFVGVLKIAIGLYFFPSLRDHLPSQKGLALIFGIASLVLGISTLFTRSAKYSRSGAIDDSEETTGIRAVGIGIFEIIVGICLIVFYRNPNSFPW